MKVTGTNVLARPKGATDHVVLTASGSAVRDER
jgi:hypothetical protein